MLPAGSAKDINLASVFGRNQKVPVKDDRSAQLVCIALPAVAQQKRVAVISVVHAQSPAADHTGIGTGYTVSTGTRSAAAFVMEVEPDAHDGYILTQALVLAVDA